MQREEACHSQLRKSNSLSHLYGGPVAEISATDSQLPTFLFSCRAHRLGLQNVREIRSNQLHPVFRRRQRAPCRLISLISRQAPVARRTAAHIVVRRPQLASFCSVVARSPHVGKRGAKRGLPGIQRREQGLNQ